LESSDFEGGAIGVHNAEIINNLIVNIVENSYGKPYIKLDEAHFEALRDSKADNYEYIYKSGKVTEKLGKTVEPMMAQMYEKLLSDLVSGNRDSVIFTHHIDYVNTAHYKREVPYEETEPNQIVVDYIASMTDDYFVDLYARLFPESTLTVTYHGYFD
jgi:dGTPase